MSSLPLDLRTVPKEYREEMKDFWSRCSENDRRMVHLISSMRVEAYKKDYYKNFLY